MKRARCPVVWVLAVSSLGCVACNPHVNSGVLKMTEWDYAGAEWHFKRAVLLDSNDADAHMWLGRSHAIQREYMDAVREFERAVGLDSAYRRDFEEYPLYFWSVYYNAGLDHSSSGDWTSAQRAVLQAIDILPDSASAREYLRYIRMQISGEPGRFLEEGIEKHREFEKRLERDFRESNWQMTRVDVKRTERDLPAEEDMSAICYRGQVGELECVYYYEFLDHRLVGANCLFTCDHGDKNEYISDYRTVRKLLNQRYGPPIHETVAWHDATYKEDRRNWGLAVSRGHVVFLTRWETLTTRIELSVSGESSQITHRIEYQSKFW